MLRRVAVLFTALLVASRMAAQGSGTSGPQGAAPGAARATVTVTATVVERRRPCPGRNPFCTRDRVDDDGDRHLLSSLLAETGANAPTAWSSAWSGRGAPPRTLRALWVQDTTTSRRGVRDTLTFSLFYR